MHHIIVHFLLPFSNGKRKYKKKYFINSDSKMSFTTVFKLAMVLTDWWEIHVISLFWIVSRAFFFFGQLFC